jgi:hypothetical protein
MTEAREFSFVSQGERRPAMEDGEVAVIRPDIRQAGVTLPDMVANSCGSGPAVPIQDQDIACAVVPQVICGHLIASQRDEDELVPDEFGKLDMRESRAIFSGVGVIHFLRDC